MFRSRNASFNNENVQTSSLSSGNASIQRRTTPPVVVTEPYYTTEPISYHEEVIDLQAPPPTKKDLTIESMSAVIAAAVLMSSAGGAPSSLSLGSASILQPTASVKRKSRFFSNPWKKSPPTSPTHSIPATPGLEPSSPFDSTSNITDDDNSSQGSPRNSSVSASAAAAAVTPDDGRDELLYRGIQIKEIKTTLKTLVISDQARNPMPQVKLERPGFARINY